MVGSFPAKTAREALQSCGKGLGDTVFSLPDGETGLRWAWVNFLAALCMLCDQNLIVHYFFVYPSRALPQAIEIGDGQCSAVDGVWWGLAL